MIISAIFLLAILILLSKTVSINRRALAVIAICLYTAITVFDLIYMETVCNMSFHYSDPSHYYYLVKGIDFKTVINNCHDASNYIYPFINWVYSKVWVNSTLISFIIKINNILIFVFIYLLCSYKIQKTSYIDYVLIFNPYTIMTIMRNVRDVYIILFIVLILLGLGVFEKNKINRIWLIIGLLGLMITRAILLFPIFVIIWIKYRHKVHVVARRTIYVLGVFGVMYYLSQIIQIVSVQMISAMEYYNENTDAYIQMLDGVVTTNVLVTLIPRLLIAGVVLLFTPHPINYISKWINDMDSTGSLGIYTGYDNILISMGSIYNYIYVIPLIILYILNFKNYNKYITIFVTIYLLIYTISFLGVVDIRNKNLAIFFILISILLSNKSIALKRKHLLLSAGIFCTIWIIS